MYRGCGILAAVSAAHAYMELEDRVRPSIPQPALWQPYLAVGNVRRLLQEILAVVSRPAQWVTGCNPATGERYAAAPQRGRRNPVLRLTADLQRALARQDPTITPRIQTAVVAHLLGWPLPAYFQTIRSNSLLHFATTVLHSSAPSEFVTVVYYYNSDEPFLASLLRRSPR